MPAFIPLAATLARAAWRGWRAKPISAALNVLGLAIGIAVYLAIRIVNHSATQSFQAGIDLVAGRSDLEITAPTGVVEALHQKVSGFPGVRAATPIVEGYATLAATPGEYLRIIGVDPFTAGPFFEAVEGGAATAWQGGTEAWLAEKQAIVVNAAWAEQQQLAKGSSLVLLIQGTPVTVKIAGTFPAPSGRSDSIRTAFLDIGWAQELLRQPGRLASIQVIAAAPLETTALAATIQKELPLDTRIQPPAQRNRQVSLMLQGFQLNLTALSMVSLLVGVFLIGNTISASVVRQRREIGVMRAIGASRAQVRTVFLAEAAFSALLGGLLGIPLARLIAAGLLEGVSQTISIHYVLLSIDKLWISPAHVVQALACGLLAALGGAWLPAREASAVDPIGVLRPGRNIAPHAVSCWRPIGPALCLIALAALLAWLSLRTGPPWLSFASCLLLVLGFVLLARPSAHATAWLAERLVRGWPRLILLRMGAANLAKSLHRAVPVIAALMTSVAMVLGVTIMIHSFRGTLALWVDSALKADLYIAPAANEVIKRSSTLPPGLIEHLEKHPSTAHLETLREDRVTLTDGSEYTLRAINLPNDSKLPWTAGDADAQQSLWKAPGHVAASEVLATRRHWQAGQTVLLSTPVGPQPFIIAGIFHDYADDQGCLYITRENYARTWIGKGYHAVAVFLKDPSAASDLEAELRQTFNSSDALSIYQNRALRTRVFEVFDQTFAVTELLRVIAIAVALLGITLALGTLVAERAWDIAALRSIGAGRRQIAALHLTEAGLIGWISAILGMACGLLLSMILTWVVNKAFFGWTVRYEVPWSEWLTTPLWVTATALAAGLFPAWQAAKTNLASALRSE